MISGGIRSRGAAAGIVVLALMTGLLTIPAVAADVPPATGPVADRVKAVAAWQAGGPVVRRAAEAALAGSDADVTAFVTAGQAAAQEQDLRARIEELIATSGPGVRAAGTAALAGPAAGLQTFVTTGARNPYEHDQRVLLSQIMTAGGPGVRDSANTAMAGTLDDVIQFLNVGQYTAREHDDRVKLSQLMTAGGPEVKNAANTAMAGTVEDVRDFLNYGYQTAAAHDQETLTVAQLADLTKNASNQASEQATVAKDAAAKAIDATALAKQAGERAAAETQAAQADASKASNAAGRAADAAGRAADAAQSASSAAKAANEAARQAANAAANAAAAATKAANAASRAQSAAARAAGDASQADQARAAAVDARNSAVSARTAAEASGWAEKASTEAKTAALAAESAGNNAAAAAQASADAASASNVSSDAAYRARQAAARAKSAAAEATRAAKATVKIADDASAAAREAQQAANASAAHAEAAAAAADEAAAHAGNAANAAATAQAAATAAGAAAQTASDSATQAHEVADIARASDQERLDAQQAAEVATAQQAYRDEELKARTAVWEAGKTTQLAADTEQLITQATTAGTAQSVAVIKGRQAAVRLLDAGGPWTKAAAQTALEGDENAVLYFLSTNLARAREQDDRTSAMAIAQAPAKLELRLAAETASVGTAAQVRDFLDTGAYPGQESDDRVLLSQIMTAGGPGVRDSANTAMAGTHADVRQFLNVGQYTAREHDNRVLISQAMTAGGPEVQAAAQAAIAGPASGLVPFLQTGLLKAQQRDAVTAAHVATVQSYLASIDGSVALASRYAAEAAQSYATARGASEEAAGYANQAQTSAAQAADWAAKAAASAAQAQTSATQANAYAKQALASAATAKAAANRASTSAAMATSSANQAQQYAATAKTAADNAQASAVAAGKSRDEAAQAAKEAQDAVWKKQQEEAAAGQVQTGTATTDPDGGRLSFIEVQPRADTKPEIVNEDTSNCDKGDTSNPITNWISGFNPYHKNAAGVDVCDVKVTVKVTGTVDYVMKTCPEPALSIEACKGKYSDWDILVLSSTVENTQYTTTVEVSSSDYERHYKVHCSGTTGSSCRTGDSGEMLLKMLTGDFVKCFNNPNLSSCAWAASTFIPVGTLTKATKEIVAFRFAIQSGVGLDAAKLALQATLNGYSDAIIGKLLATADKVTAFRLTLKDGVGTEKALTGLHGDPNVGRALIDQLDDEARIADQVRTACKATNSFPAGTGVLMADGSTRSIEQIRIGDLVTATDPSTGATSSQRIEATIYTPDDREFTELTIAATDGSISAITSTSHHPYWSENAHDWRDAAALTVGDNLRAPGGQAVRITSIRNWTELQPAYNLTVSNVHTYYVLAGTTPVLVHNSDFSSDTWCPAVFAVLGNGEYMSPAGLVYASGKVFHVLDHTVPNPSRLTHTVFLEQNPIKALDLVDKAWSMRSKAIRTADEAVWIVPMDEVIGTNGEKFIRLAIDPGTSRILSAYPVTGP